MPTFDDREEAFERRFAQDGEMRFKAGARANRALAAWASGLLGHDATAAAAYADSLGALALAADREGATRAKLETDLASLGDAASSHRIGRRMDEAFARALADLKAGR
ncbi:MAG: DUF1476 family protein [Hyphomicrobiales bacterium]|nr:DUF1476 family protein [Hyphomicrobiales bacterium]